MGTRIVAEPEHGSHPAISIAEREGDPWGAIALSIFTGAPRKVNLGLGQTLIRRMSSLSGAISLYPGDGGLTLTFPLEDAAAVSLFIKETEKALRFPLTSTELAGQIGAGIAINSDGSTETLPACDSDIAFGIPSLELSLLESARNVAYHRCSAHFALVGNRVLGVAAQKALDESAAWPNKPCSTETFASEPPLTIRTGHTERDSLIFALHVVKPEQAIRAAERLNSVDSALSGQLRTASREFSLGVVDVHLTPRGGAWLCVRASTTATTTPLTPTMWTRVTRLITTETRRVLSGGATSSTLDQFTITPTDPAEAAYRLALAGLAARQSGSQRSMDNEVLHVVTHTSPPPELSAAIKLGLNKNWEIQPLERRERLELGQTRILALLAAPCPSVESTSYAGATAAWLTSLTWRLPELRGVRFQPYITTDALGIIAEAEVKDDSELPAELAERLGGALGALITTGGVSVTDINRARDAFYGRFGATPRSAFWSLLEALAPGQTTLLEPRGTWISTLGWAKERFEQARAAWLEGPLRLAVIANRDHQQPLQVETAIMRWLRLYRNQRIDCPSVSTIPPRTSEIKITTRDTDVADASLYMGFSLPVDSVFDERYAELLLELLTEPKGLLARALQGLDEPVAFNATVFGGHSRRALILAAGVTPEAQDTVIEKLRTFFATLGHDAPTDIDLDQALVRLGLQHHMAEKEPRRRLVELWQGAREELKSSNFSGFRSFLIRSFSGTTPIVVRVVGHH